MTQEQLSRALKGCLSGARFSTERMEGVLQAARGGHPMKKKAPLAVVLAAILTLLLICGALAASLGVFGRFGSLQNGDAGKLQTLDAVSQTYNETQSLPAPEALPTDAACQTDYDRLLAHQQEKRFDLTLNQAYCAGDKLYLAYTLSAPETATFCGVGQPSGVAQFDSREDNKTFAESRSSLNEHMGQLARDWFALHPVGWFAYDTFSLGDGARLPDGTVLDIEDSGESWPDSDAVMIGYMTLTLPDDLPDSDTLTCEVTIGYGTSLAYQDETGVSRLRIVSPETGGRARLTFTISRDGTTRSVTGSAAFAAYTAQADLLLSAIELHGTVTLADCPQSWIDSFPLNGDGEPTTDRIYDYQLIVGDQPIDSIGSGLGLNDQGQLELLMQFPPPPADQPLALRPVYTLSGPRAEEDVPIT